MFATRRGRHAGTRKFRPGLCRRARTGRHPVRADQFTGSARADFALFSLGRLRQGGNFALFSLGRLWQGGFLFCFPLAGEGKGESFCFPRPVEARRKSRSFSKAGAGRSGNFGERYPWAGAVYISYRIHLLSNHLSSSFFSIYFTYHPIIVPPLLDISRLERGGILLGFSFLFPFSCISYDERD